MGPHILGGLFDPDAALAVESPGRLAVLGTGLLLQGHGNPSPAPIAEATDHFRPRA